MGVAKVGESFENKAHRVLLIIAAAVAVLLLSYFAHVAITARKKRQRAPRVKARSL